MAVTLTLSLTKAKYYKIPMKDAKEIADKYLERYSTLVASSSRILLLAIIVLIANWIFVVEFKYAAYSSTNQYFKEKFDNIETERTKIEKYSNDTTIYNKEKERLQKERKELEEEKKSSLGDKATEIKDLQSLVKFIFFITDDQQKGALILNLLFCGLLMYIYLTRLSALKYISRAIRIYKIEPHLQINPYHDFNLVAPIWLAPLPKIKNKEVAPSEITTILGWSFNHKIITLTIGFFFATILLIQSRLSYVAFVVNKGELNNSIFLLSVISLLVTSAIVTFWLIPIKVEDNFNIEKNPNSFSRREFSILSAYIILSIVFYESIPYITKKIYKNPRYVKKKRAKIKYLNTSHKSMLVINNKSEIVHYIDAEGFSLCFLTLKSTEEFNKFSRNLALFDSNSKMKLHQEKPRLNIRFSSYYAEKFALDHINAGRIEEASKILLYSIEQNLSNFSPSIRLHDLLAKVCIKHKNSHKQLNADWVRLIELSNNSKVEELTKRAKKWQNREWVNKMMSSSKINFNFVEI
jgi:hypothetical protein